MTLAGSRGSSTWPVAPHCGHTTARASAESAPGPASLLLIRLLSAVAAGWNYRHRALGPGNNHGRIYRLWGRPNACLDIGDQVAPKDSSGSVANCDRTKLATGLARNDALNRLAGVVAQDDCAIIKRQWCHSRSGQERVNLFHDVY